MSTDALNAALVALSGLRFPEAALKPFRDVIVERAAMLRQKVDNGKLLEQLAQAKNQKVKLRDVVKAEEWLAMASRVFENPDIISPWQDTLVEFGYIKSFYGEDTAAAP
jgi:hypothetical protein